MKELLALCDFEPEEITKEMPRIQKAFDRLQLTDKHIDVAKEQLNKYFEIDSKGLRLIFKIMIREMANLVMAREEHEKLIYVAMPSLSPALVEAAMIADKNVYGSFPDLLMLLLHGALFRNLDYIYGAAEKSALPIDGAHCGCSMGKWGLQTYKMMPKPDLSIGWGIFCDEAVKVDDLVSKHFGIPVHFVDRIQDTNWEESITERDLKYFSDQMRMATAKIEEVIGRKIPDEMIWQAQLAKTDYYQTLIKIIELSISADPIPLSANTITWAFQLFVMSISPENVPLRQEAANLLLEETQQRIDRGEGFYEKGAPRIAVGVFTSLVEPAVDYVIRDAGLAVALLEVLWWIPEAQLTPTIGEEMDPYRLMAETFLRVTLVAPLAHRITTAAKAVEKYNLDGFLGLPHYSCRPFMSDALTMKNAISAMGIPATVMEADIYDYRNYGPEQQRTKIESFAEVCKIAKMKKTKAA